MSDWRSTFPLALIIACATACSPDRGGGGSAQTGVVTLSETGSSTTGPSSTTADKFDVAGGDAGNTGGDVVESCKKVDLLFVIDNSGSMADEQSNLVASFPGFIDSIQTELADAMGYHIGVTTSDDYFFHPPGCIIEGALVRQTGGADSSNSTCTPYASGANYMDENDDLTNKFSCAAQVGTSGEGNERPMYSLQEAISPAMNDIGGCNEGFIREDALLVLVVITDEEDDHETDDTCTTPLEGSPGEPIDWFDSVVAIKGGIESNVVVLALVGPDGANQCPPIDKCIDGIDGAEVAPRILAFTDMFTNGFVGQVCAPSYDPFFQEAVGVVKSACDDFMPPG